MDEKSNSNRKQTGKCMSESNLEDLEQNVQQTKDRNTYSAQYTCPTTSNLEQIRRSRCVNPGNPCPCFHSPPPCPQFTPPENDLWDLQFCRWWGWNWVKKRNEMIDNRPCPGRTKNETVNWGRGRNYNRRKPPKQDDFFSWCNRLFRGRRRGDCLLEEKQKVQLQEMYDTPSTAESCLRPHHRGGYYKPCRRCSEHTQRSMSTIVVGNKRSKCRVYLCESSSSDEGFPCVCQHRVKKKCVPSTSESLEYLSLRLKCLNSDCENNVPQTGHRRSCAKHCQLAPAMKKYTKKSCKHRCHNQNVCLVPRFARQSCESKCDNYVCKCPHRSTNRVKDYIIQFPFLRHKKLKCNCACECKQNNNPKPTADKSSSCPKIKTTKFNDILEDNEPWQIPTQNFKGVANDFFNTVSSSIAKGVYSSPVSGKVYNLKPKLFSPPVTPRRTRFPSLKDVTEKIAGYTESLPAADNEHKLLMAAVCEAMASNQPSDDESYKSSENMAPFFPRNYENADCIDPNEYNRNIEHPNRKLYVNTGSRIPLLKKRLIKNNEENQDSNTTMVETKDYTGNDVGSYAMNLDNTDQPVHQNRINDYFGLSYDISTLTLQKPKNWSYLDFLLKTRSKLVNENTPNTSNAGCDTLLSKPEENVQIEEEGAFSQIPTVVNGNEGTEVHFRQDLLDELSLEDRRGVVNQHNFSNDGYATLLHVPLRPSNYGNVLEPILEENCLLLSDPLFSSSENVRLNTL
ncbi:uncharacterized protein LOC116180059 [Photinus pyralis]|uniref:uncharacterized protein LOC116180059 n=1 Tax=Photinus pyralis TaxID=7054 RepID=UPI0012678105|nr:uncharacterized protein LOC116180059 [Photinus pyralis]